MSLSNAHGHSVTDGYLDQLPTKILRHGPSGAQTQITVRGATVLSWQAPFKGELGHFLAGFTSQADFESQAGMRNSLMFPFANRLKNDQYTWDGTTYSVPKQYDRDPEVIHGFVRVNDWAVGATEVEDPNFVAQSFTYQIRAKDQDWYPFDLDVTVRYELSATGLAVRFSYKNVGATSAPAGGGWHPYWRIPGHDTFNDLKLQVPGRTRVLMDDSLNPLPAEAAYASQSQDTVHYPLAGVHYDDAWVDLVPDTDGLFRTTLTEPDTGAGLAIWQNYGSVLVFTEGEFPVPRGSIAIEPVESTTNAFNRPDRDQDVRLAPGQERVFEFGGTVVTGSVQA